MVGSGCALFAAERREGLALLDDDSTIYRHVATHRLAEAPCEEKQY